MLKTSEWVALGHPDKMADYISQCLLDRYISIDPGTRFAVEVMVKGNKVFLGGEVTSGAHLGKQRIEEIVRQAVEQVGYSAEYAEEWGRDNCPCADSIEVFQEITSQSPDIAKGVDSDGWGDQGIFWGMATPDEETEYMPKDIYLARKLGTALYESCRCGIDIKAQVTVEGKTGEVAEVVVAAPEKEEEAGFLLETAQRVCGCDAANIHINGTGRYVRHGSVADCGVTGRKLAVDFYGGNSPIGGGAPWTKDGTKADLSLNLLAREIAILEAIEANETRRVALSCRIGSPEITAVLMDGEYNELRNWKWELPPSKLIEKFHLDEPNYARICRVGLCYYKS